MAGSIIVSSITLDSDNNFSIKSNTGATLFFANTTGIDIANSIGATAITNDKILSVANTKITGNIISSQIASVNGSVITANTIANSAIQTGAVENYMNAAGLGFGMRNRIINGAMVIDQRNAGASVTPNSTYTLDRWQGQNSQTGKYTVQQNASSVTPPTGFSYYLGVTSSSAYTVLTGDYFMIVQPIEGYNFADMAWGTAAASTVTLSFWVRSSLTGTFGGSLRNSASSRSYPFSYTISVANTWEQKSTTITGDTTGTWIGATNGIGVNVFFGLGVGATFSGTAGSWSANNYVSATGATSVVGTNGATFYITGVQLEKGSTATSFDYRPYGTELQLCQRYYENNYSTGYAVGSIESYPYNVGQFVQGYTSSSGQKFQTANFFVPKRTSQPTLTFYDGAGNSGKVSTLDAGGTSTDNVSIGITFISDKYLAAGPSTGTMTGSRYFWVCSAEL